MALKDNIEALKQELSAQEQLLENIIAGERFFKKHKRKIVFTMVVLVVLLVGYVSSKVIKTNNLEASNEAYRALALNPDDKHALSVLESKNVPLYRAFVFRKALKSGDKEVLRTLLGDKDIIANLVSYELQENLSNDNILENLVILEEGYKFLKEGKVDEASVKFMTIPSNSAVVDIAKRLEHYQPSKKEDK